MKKIIDGAKFFYLEGYFLTHGLESAMILAKHSKEHGKVGNPDTLLTVFIDTIFLEHLYRHSP